MRGVDGDEPVSDNLHSLADKRAAASLVEGETARSAQPKSSRYLPSRFLDPTLGHSSTVRLLSPVLAYQEAETTPAWSDETPWHEVAQTRDGFEPMALDQGWPHIWTFDTKYRKKIESTSVAQVSTADILAADPIRRPLWYPGKKSRAGTRHVTSTGRHHAHDSIFERNTLILLDWGQADSILSQPGTLSFHIDGRRRTHTPDFAVVVDGVFTLINCRPAHLVDEALLQKCAAVNEVCLTRGWRSLLIVGYEQVALSTLQAVSAKRNADDWLGYYEEIIDLLNTSPPSGDWTFEAVCNSFEYPMEARSMLQRLIWERLVAVDLAVLLCDDSVVRLAGSDTTR